MSSRSDSETENANSTDLRNDEFIKLLEENSALFDKSQTPGIQKKKRQCVEQIQQRYFEQTSKHISAKKIRKRICNMRAEVRKCLRYNLVNEKKPIKLKDWHKRLLNLMHDQHDTYMDEITDEEHTNTANEFNNATIKMESLDCDSEFMNNFNDDAILPPVDIAGVNFHQSNTITPFQRLSQESEETKNLSNGDLERAILLAKYELIALQTQAAKEQLELISLQKKNARYQT